MGGRVLEYQAKTILQLKQCLPYSITLDKVIVQRNLLLKS